MRISITDLDSIGIIFDQSPWELPLAAWTSGLNVRFANGGVERFLGHETYVTPEIDPLWLINTPTTELDYWVYAGKEEVYCFLWNDTGGDHTNITRADLPGSPPVPQPYDGAVSTWTGGILNGIPVINDGSVGNPPQAWNPPDADTLLVDLPNWPAGYRCKALRVYRNYLVAMDIIKGGERYPHLVLWSHSADPGTLPDSWDISDTTKEAGELALAETPGEILDSVLLRNTNIIYKSDATYTMQYQGGSYVFKFDMFLRTQGMLARHCARPMKINGDQHLVLGYDDLFVHNGNDAQSILTKRLRQALMSSIDTENYGNCFLVPLPKRDEMWVCYPQMGSTYADMALVWNWVDNTFTFRELPSVAFGELGRLDADPGQQWDPDSEEWNLDQTIWDWAPYTPVTREILLAKPGTALNIFAADRTLQFNGLDYTSYVERIGIAVIGKSYSTGKPIVDTEKVKLCREVWPRIEGPDGEIIQVFIGSQMERNDPVHWQGPMNYVIGASRKLDCLISGKLLAIRFKSVRPIYWKLTGYDLDIVPLGGY